MQFTNDNTKAQSLENCPMCGEPMIEKYTPFCSKRCADLDLHRWLNGGYAIPAVESEEEGLPDFALEE